MLNRGIGDNIAEINYAAEEAERLSRDYAETVRTVDELEVRFNFMPAEIANQAEKDKVAALIKDMRDANKRVEGFRELEKQPHFRRSQGVDGFFFRLSERLFRRDRKDQPGAADTLQQRLTAYDSRILLAEQERRRLEAQEAERIARQKIEAQMKAEREAEAARLAAARARKAETTAAKTEAAQQAQAAASEAAVQSQIAADQADAARMDTYARPAEIMRQRGESGVMTTMARENYAEVIDEALLDKAALWPFISIDAKEKALRAWARNTGHRQQMAGAAIGDRPKSQVR